MSNDPHSLVAPVPPGVAGPPADEKKLLQRTRRLLWIGGGVLVALVVIRLAASYAAERRLAQSAQSDAALRVAVTRPQISAQAEELVLPASVQAYVEAPIYARTHGYLKQWYFDIGAHVRRGQLLAEIEAPEQDQQLAQAQAELKTLEANAQLAERTAQRWQSLVQKHAVSKQEADQAESDYTAKLAGVEAGKANVRRLEQLQDYEKVYAPFDGVITARDTDIGALIDAGSSPRALFHLAAVSKLRVYAAVPETSASAIKAGRPATLTSDQLPNRVFPGTVVRDSGSIDAATRTLNVEVDVDNAAGELLPGSYGFVHLPLPGSRAPLTVPANTLIFRAQGLQVAVVRHGHAVLVPIKIGRDFGDTVEVTAGLTPSDTIILDPSDSLLDGAAVEVEGGK